MKTFHCSACQALVFFENSQCLNCGRTLAFVADQMTMVTVEQAASAGAVYRLCANYSDNRICNWAIHADDSAVLCRACDLTQNIPNLNVPGNLENWAKLEAAKRRLVYALLSLELPLANRRDDPVQGLEFKFLNDSVAANGDRSRVLTGHDNGVITINAAEADDVYRENKRQMHHEPYRTLLGHFRHEIGHYYWDRLIAGGGDLQTFRQLFGNEELDYQEALKVHYGQGAPAGWENNFISAYATAHPWEDWAESWAHVMHMVDALETAHALGLSVAPARPDEPSLAIPAKASLARIGDFDQLIRDWLSLTYVLNNLTRGLGLADAYPFVLSGPVIEKLRFVCRSMIG